MDIMRQTTCHVENPMMVYSYCLRMLCLTFAVQYPCCTYLRFYIQAFDCALFTGYGGTQSRCR